MMAGACRLLVALNDSATFVRVHFCLNSPTPLLYLDERSQNKGLAQSAQWMEALAFIRLFTAACVCGPQEPANGSAENLYPSEDGEALQRIAPGSFQTECASIASGAAKASYSARWFAVYTTCRHEKRVAQHFNQRDIEYYLPLYRVERRWRDGSRVTLDLPLFPNYIFVHIDRSERVRVLNVPGALTVVGGTGREPLPLPDAAVEALRFGLEQRRVEPHPLLTAGQQVRIRSGAFAGMEGVVLRKKSGLRVVITLQQIMQSVAVEVDEDDLEVVGAELLAPVLIADLSQSPCLARA